MSVLRRGGSRRRRVALVAALTVGAFQVLAIVGAGVASAAGTCAFDLATSRVNISITSATASTLAVSDGTVAGTAAGDFLFDGAPCGGSPNNSNTVSVNVTTAVSATAEGFVIDNTFGAPDREFSSTIAWFVDLGQGPGDALTVTGADQTDNVYVFTNTSFTIDGAAGTTAGLEIITANGSDGSDTLDGSALGTGVQFFGNGGAGVADFVAPGAHVADSLTGGGQAGDTLSYGTRTTSTTIGAPAGFAGFDANANCALLAPEELDAFVGFDTYETGSANDCLVGTAAAETFIPGDGDDAITGAGGTDTLDYSSSSAGMVIDPALGTATGQGADTFSSIEGFIGSAFDDTLLWPAAGVVLFVGGDGVDTVDASARTTGQLIDLDTLDGLPLAGAGAPADSTENAIGGTGNDTLLGNDVRNDLDGGDGDDVLSGFAGNDTLRGGLGNDTFSGGTGADRVSFLNSPNRVVVDMNLGFATGEGDDGFAGPGVDVEIIQGSKFNDQITGGGGVIAVNFIFSGAAGNDRLTGSGSNDTLRGGKGNDRLRGLEGGDTLRGGGGSRDRAWGGPQVDFCKAEFEQSCEA